MNRRLRKLEDPRSPREHERELELRRKRQEIEERALERYETIASEHPERVDDYLEATEELHRAMEEHDEGTSEYHDALDAYLEAEQLFEQGWVSGHSCEDCGRAAVHYKETGYEGTCQHCGGATSYYGYWLKRVISLEKLDAEIAATRRLGYGEKAEKLAALHERRLMDGNNELDERNGEQ